MGVRRGRPPLIEEWTIEEPTMTTTAPFPHRLSRAAGWLLALLLLASAPAGAEDPEQKKAADPAGAGPLARALEPIDEYRTPGLEAELSGIYPHATDDDLYYVLANAHPPYQHGQTAQLDRRYHGHLLTVNRQGEIVSSLDLGDEHFGGLAIGDGFLYVALTNAAELLRIDPSSGEVVGRIPTASAVGGLDYDAERGVLLAHMYVGFPHIAVIDAESGALLETIAADESTMGLAKVDGDWLATWASGWEPGSISELRVLDPESGEARARLALDETHSVLAPADDGRGGPALLALVTSDSESGRTVLRRYAYVGSHRWQDDE